MRVAVVRNALVLQQPGTSGRVRSRPLTAPINDLIALRPEIEYVLYLYHEYFDFWPSDWLRVDEDGELDVGKLIDEIDEQLTAWRRRRYHVLFRTSAEQATDGHLDARLAPCLGRIGWHPAADEVPTGDLPTLAVYGLLRALQLRQLELIDCPSCQTPWLRFAEGETNPYCLRPAPGYQSSCRQQHKEELYQQRHGDWRREYKRLHERVRRGSLSEQDMHAWQASNSPEDWEPFETWQAQVATTNQALPQFLQKSSPRKGPAIVQKLDGRKSSKPANRTAPDRK